jgi:clan AA aspartic protease (TIGR02281 family)
MAPIKATKIAIALAAMLATGATAQTKLYRCELPDGKIAYQDNECPSDTKNGSLIEADYAPQKRLTVYRNETNTYLGTITINGVTVKGPIDTGATWLTLTPQLARKMKIKFTGRPTTYTTTANGRIQTEITHAPIVKLGDMEVYNVEVSINANSPTLIGMSVLRNFKIADENGNLVLIKR